MGSRRPSSVSISLDGVDSRRLLKKARHEVPEVIKRIKEKMFGKKKNRNMLQVSPGDFLRAFMDPSTLLGLMQTFINKKNISRDPASSSNIIAFLHVELMLYFYKVRRSKCQDRSHDKVRISRLDYRFPGPAMYFDPLTVGSFSLSTSIRRLVFVTVTKLNQ